MIRFVETMTTAKARKYLPAFNPSNGGMLLGKGTRNQRLDPKRLRIEKNRVYKGTEAILIDDKVYFVGYADPSKLTNAVSAWEYEQDKKRPFGNVEKYRQLYKDSSGVDEGSNFWDKT